MAKVLSRTWRSEVSGGSPRRDRRSCSYEAYIPDRLLGRVIALDGQVAADVADAESAIARMNVGATTLVDTEALARLLLRADSVASSKIEGLEVGGRRLLRAEAARTLGESWSDVTAEEVLANIDAMVSAMRSTGDGPAITRQHLLEVQRRLLAGARLDPHHVGRFRTEQNWIRGSSNYPCSTAFVPSPAELVDELVDDLQHEHHAPSRTTTSSSTTTATSTTTTSTTTTTTLPPPTVVITAPPPSPPPPPASDCNPNSTPCVPVSSDVDRLGGSGNGPA